MLVKGETSLGAECCLPSARKGALKFDAQFPACAAAVLLWDAFQLIKLIELQMYQGMC